MAQSKHDPENRLLIAAEGGIPSKELSSISQKFHSHKEIYITSTNSISAHELFLYLVPKFSRSNPIFPKYTVFYIIDGIHGGPDGKPHKTDGNLTQTFYFGLIKKLKSLCGFNDCSKCKKGCDQKCDGPFMWNDMAYDEKHIQIATDENFDWKTYQCTYTLSDLSKEHLKKLAKKLCKTKKPSVLIFASCYSKWSSINETLRSNGIFATLNISKDRAEVTDGKGFLLNSQQKEIINQVRSHLEQDDPQNIFLWGSGGTGKTLLMAEILQMYHSFYKMKGVPTKILVIVYHSLTKDDAELLNDLRTKYFVANMFLEDNFSVKTFKQACKGNSSIKLK